MLVSGQERRHRLTGSMGNQRVAQEVKDRALLLETGFEHGQDAFHKPAAQVRMSAVRRAPVSIF